eukprot:TRINITY_DN3227_c0_g1_i1.p1 TRINITY_DN3227_c0_g1~~TRINITY_DN3227_c0_g1_i1.p1  ORF type:complete len:372 (+),score=153.33 TRINITY_DN3227_c0_g1_i1:157-1272(+)
MSSVEDDTQNQGLDLPATTTNARLNCRMYEQRYPEVDDLVMVSVRSIADMGVYVSLLEYNNIEGMILLSELSRRRIRSISKLIRVGRQEVVVVLRVDKEKGYIDLSKRRVSPEEISKCEEKYNKSKAVHSIMRHVAEITKTNLEDLYKSFGWPLYKQFGHAYDAFKIAITDAKVFDSLDINPEVKDVLVKDIRRRLTPQPVKIRADIEVTCFDYEGIDAIKAALIAGQKVGSEDVPIKIKLVAPPLYVMVTTSLDKDKGIAKLNEAIVAAREEIQKRKGDIKVKVAPRAVSDREDRELTAVLEELERKNREVSGDSDDESDEEEEKKPKTKKKADEDDEDDEDDDEDDEEEEEEEEEEEKPKGKGKRGGRR